MGFYPDERNCKLAFLVCFCCLPDFLYEVIVMFCIFERSKGNSAVCVYCYFSWDIVLFFLMLCNDYVKHVVILMVMEHAANKYTNNK